MAPTWAIPGMLKRNESSQYVVNFVVTDCNLKNSKKNHLTRQRIIIFFHKIKAPYSIFKLNLLLGSRGQLFEKLVS